MPAHRVLSVTLLGAGALVATALATADTQARSRSSETIAAMTTSDFRVVVSAAKTSSGQAPSASVTVKTFERSFAGWRPTGARVLEEPYFWKTLTGPRAVCRLEIRTAGQRAGSRPRAIVQLLQSPSLGCGPATSLRLT
jgi:hypothetical protein